MTPIAELMLVPCGCYQTTHDPPCLLFLLPVIVVFPALYNSEKAVRGPFVIAGQLQRRLLQFPYHRRPHRRLPPHPPLRIQSPSSVS